MVRPLKMAIFLLSVHTLLDQCLLNLHPTCITDFPTHLMHVPASDGFRLKSGFSTMIVKGAMRHVPTCWFLCSPMSQRDISSPKTGNLLLHWRGRTPPHPAHILQHMVGYGSRTMLQTCVIPDALNHWWICPWLWALSLILKLGKGFPGGLDDKESAWNSGDLGLIPGWGRSPREGNGNPLWYSCLENPMDRGAWQATDHGVTKSQTQLND